MTTIAERIAAAGIEVARAHDYLLEDERDNEEEEVLPW